ncbi:MAG: site-specific integrase, partial [bacterium]
MASVYKRKLKNGDVWYAQVKLNGGGHFCYNTKIPLSLKGSYKKAMHAALEIQAEILAGNEKKLFGDRFVFRGDQGNLIKNLIEQYIENRFREWSPGTLELQRHTFRLLANDFGDCHIREFGSEQVIRFREMLIQRGALNSQRKKYGELSAHTVNIHLRNLRAFLRWVHDERIFKNWIFPKVTMMRAVQEDQERDHFTPEEVEKLLKTARGFYLKGQCVAPFLAVLILTGMRRNEVVNLEWRDVDFEHGRIILRPAKTKTGLGRDIPICDELKMILESLNGTGDGLVFTGLDGHAVTRQFPNICRVAGIRILKLHNCRDTFAANAVLGNMPPLILQRIMGHSDIRTTSS